MVTAWILCGSVVMEVDKLCLVPKWVAGGKLVENYAAWLCAGPARAHYCTLHVAKVGTPLLVRQEAGWQWTSGSHLLSVRTERSGAFKIS